MASITITVQSLLNTAVYDSYTIDDGQTVDQLKAAVQSATSVDPAWFDIVFKEEILAGGSTLASFDIIEDSALRTHNKINKLATRQLRQEAKLALAILDRTASNKRHTLNIDDLPTKYSGDTIVDNPNSDGAGGILLVEGRPWS